MKRRGCQLLIPRYGGKCMTIREQLEQREETYLSPYAMLSKKTRGRRSKEEECDIRPAFQRDRDRILHCKAFRRLKQKTQVFLLPKGDHYRTRLTHTLEVSQNARTIAKALRLNEDLVEAIALGHDLGHTPYGHAGERALNALGNLKFCHSLQSVRVVELIEKKGQGLNLTREVLDGILEHQTSGAPATLEGQIVRLSDKIAYINHDMDDAIRGNILVEEMIPKEIRRALGETTKTRLDTMVNDVIMNSMDSPKIKMSDEINEATMELRQFLFEEVYKNPKAKSEEDKAVHLLSGLFEHYKKNMQLLPEQYHIMQAKRNESDEQVICDYIAGMTDSYAVKKFEEYFVPKSWNY